MTVTSHDPIDVALDTLSEADQHVAALIYEARQTFEEAAHQLAMSHQEVGRALMRVFRAVASRIESAETPATTGTLLTV